MWMTSTLMVGMLIEPVLACVLYRVLLMWFELSLRMLMMLAALIDCPELHQCEHVWLMLSAHKPINNDKVEKSYF